MTGYDWRDGDYHRDQREHAADLDAEQREAEDEQREQQTGGETDGWER